MTEILSCLPVLPRRRKSCKVSFSRTQHNDTKSNLDKCGFRGSNSNGVTTQPYAKTCETNNYDSSHIAMTYTGLACLLILGDDLKFVNKEACLQGIKALQLPDGSFKSTLEGSENDMRFIYCACCVCAMLNDFSPINPNHAVSYILKSLSYDGAFGQGPGQESHGGSTYCACASLQLLKRLQTALTMKQLRNLQFWCVSRQKRGFHGRPHKDDDTCYSFWIGATLKLLDMFELIDFEQNEEFILTTQDIVVGGLGKWPQIHPDALHSYMGICGLSLMGLYDLQPVSPDLNISVRAKAHMKNLHLKWEEQRAQGEVVFSEAQNRSKRSSSLDRTHTSTVILAFAIGLGAVAVPWFYSLYFHPS